MGGDKRKVHGKHKEKKICQLNHKGIQFSQIS